jgi:hypothetical protein
MRDGSCTTTNFKRGVRLYLQAMRDNKRFDADKAGIACEMV